MASQENCQRRDQRQRTCSSRRGTAKHVRAIGTLIAAAHLANGQHVEIERVKDGRVVALGRIVVVDAHRQIARHIGHRIPALGVELNARRIGGQVIKVEKRLVVLKLGETEKGNAAAQIFVQIGVQRRLIDHVAARHVRLDDGETGARRLIRPHPTVARK